MKKIKILFVFSFLMVGMFLFQTSVTKAQSSSNASLVSVMQSQLHLGSRSDDVKILQAFLAADASIYPEGFITGYFGNRTKAAVARFQAKYGISAVGKVGPTTLAKINEKIDENPIATYIDANGDLQVCAMVPPGHLIAPGFLRKIGGVAPIVPDCQTLPPGIAAKLGTGFPPSGDKISPIVSAVSVAGISSGSATISWTTNERSSSQIMFGVTTSYGMQTALDNTLVNAHMQTLVGLSANTMYHYKVKSVDASGNVSISADYTFTTAVVGSDITAPLISGVSAGTITNSSATINWTTNEMALGQIYFGTSTSYNMQTSVEASFNTAHQQTMTGLSSNTLYHYLIRSWDASGNLSISADYTFTTSILPDVTDPVISNVTASAITSGSAVITWTTNEPSTSRVSFGLTGSYGMQTALDSGLVTLHQQIITGLSANTMYHFQVRSIDASSNGSTSTDSTFITL